MSPPNTELIPVQPLTVFLIKTGTAEFEDALEKPRELERYPLKDTLPFKGALFLSPQRQNPPLWLTFLQEGTAGDLANLYNASNSGVLFLRAARRVFAITFGYGRSLLRPGKIVRAFGLRVVLNAVDDEGLRSIDSKTVQELTVHTRRQTSRASRLAEFEIDKEEDLLGAVTGVPRDKDLARVLSGADALQLRARLIFAGLADKCRELYRHYRSKSYQDRGFEFIDHVREVADPSVIEKLDDNLLTKIVAGDYSGVHMAPPEIIDWTVIDGFSFVSSASPESDLRLESFFAQIRSSDDMPVERLKRQRIFVHLGEAGSPVARWPVYRALVVEREVDGRRYVLSGGSWYELDRSFVERILSDVDQIQSANIGLPSALLGEHEKAYNARVGVSRGIYCLDTKCPRADGDPIELCDLYTSQRQFVHVKRWNSSSTLSHLFAQGKVSAEAFLMDEEFRQQARSILGEQSTSLARHIPASRPDPSKFEVVFAIIKGGAHGWENSLPFFSQLHLARSAQSLRRLGFEVRLERIDVDG